MSPNIFLDVFEAVDCIAHAPKAAAVRAGGHALDASPGKSAGLQKGQLVGLCQEMRFRGAVRACFGSGVPGKVDPSQAVHVDCIRQKRLIGRGQKGMAGHALPQGRLHLQAQAGGLRVSCTHGRRPASAAALPEQTFSREGVEPMTRVEELDTPSLIIDREKLERNIAFAQARARELGAAWRPHLKTHKCVEIARMQLALADGPATVSTVREAEYFAAAGVRDMIYAVGIAPHKLARIDALNRAGADVKIILDSVPAARAVSEFCRAHQSTIGVLIEIDCDGHRSGLKPRDPEMVAVARALTDGARFKGVLTHAGESYNARSQQEIEQAAENEEQAILAARDLLAEAGFVSEIVSVGSTPTFVRARRRLAGVTEYRSGVGAFYDLVMAGIGVCRVEDIALSVLVSVIGWQKQKGWIITDGGFLAMSRDRGTASQSVDCGYGLVCDVRGRLLPELWVRQCNQEHGVICRRDGKPFDVEAFGLDTRLRILPNHACPTAAAFDRYHVVDARGVVTDVWTRCNYW